MKKNFHKRLLTDFEVALYYYLLSLRVSDGAIFNNQVKKKHTE